MDSPKKHSKYYENFVKWVKAGDSFDPEEYADEEGTYEDVSNESANKKIKDKAEELVVSHSVKTFNLSYKIITRLICFVFLCTMLFMVSHLPEFGSPDNPANNEVVERYVTKALEETGATNVVTGVILDYRAFDTFGEAVVLFLAVITVVTLLRVPGKEANKDEAKGTDDVILKNLASLLIPFILLFGIYVVLNGHLSPGGGFSGGTVMGAGLILFATAHGYEKAHKFFSFKTFTIISSSALIIYGISKGYSFFCGANGLDSGIPLGKPGAIFSGGLIFVLNICVGLVVAGTMYSFYSLFQEGEV